MLPIRLFLYKAETKIVKLIQRKVNRRLLEVASNTIAHLCDASQICAISSMIALISGLIDWKPSFRSPRRP
jgi:hypothetical protein